MSITDRLRELLEGMYDGFGSGDASVWIDHLAEDAIGIGSDPDEYWRGREVLARVIAEQVKQMSGEGIKVRPGNPTFHAEGDTAWAVDRPSIELPTGDVLPVRLTVVVTSRDDALKIRHFHMSAGTTNEESIGMQLTTS